MNDYGNLDIPLVIDKIGSRLKGLVIKNLENMPGQGEDFLNFKKI